MKHITTIFFILFVACSTLAQVSIQIIDSLTRRAVPYSSLVYQNIENYTKGDIATELGVIEIHLATVKDSLTISSIGYETRVIHKNYLVKESVVKLKPATYNLNDLTVVGYKILDRITLGATRNKKTNTYIKTIKGAYTLLFFEKPDSQFQYQIEEISINIEKGKCQSLVEIVLFAVDSSLQKPNQLNNARLVLNTVQNKGSWLTFNVKSEDIYFEKPRLAIGIDILPAENCDNKLKMTLLKGQRGNNVIQSGTYIYAKNQWIVSSKDNINILPVVGLKLIKYKK